MCDEGTIASLLLEITKKLTDKNVSFSINMSFKDFNFSASSSQKVQDSPAFPEKRKQKSPSQKARNLKRLLEHKEKMQKKLESTTSSEDSSSVTLSSKDGSAEATVSCDQCEHRTKTEGGMKQHKRRKHDVAQLDGNNSISEDTIHEVIVVNSKGTQTDETCHYCKDSIESLEKHNVSGHCPKNTAAQTQALYQLYGQQMPGPGSGFPASQFGW